VRELNEMTAVELVNNMNEVQLFLDDIPHSRLHNNQLQLVLGPYNNQTLAGLTAWLRSNRRLTNNQEACALLEQHVQALEQQGDNAVVVLDAEANAIRPIKLERMQEVLELFAQGVQLRKSRRQA